MSHRTTILAVAVQLVLALAIAIAADQINGSLSGRLTDKDTGGPVIGASVQLVGTKMGAMSDPNGRFIITKISPGVYSVKISSVEYNTVDVSGIEVKPGDTTEVNYQLTKKVTELDGTIAVTASQDPIQKYETSNIASITSQQVHLKPVQPVDALLFNSPNVQTTTNGHVFIRGGRAGEVSYIIDGVPIGDPLAGTGGAGSNLSLSTGTIQPVPLSHGGSTTVNGVPFDAMFFKDYGVNPFVDTEDDNLSTFAIDVDDASYILARSYLESGNLPPSEAVRAEEFINHFSYEYPSPRREPFSIELEGAPSQFGNSNNWMLRVGIQGKYIQTENRKPANLVFVVDVSGSMEWGNRLELVKQALYLLVEQLKPEDRVGIVVYGSTARVVLQPTSVDDRESIKRAIYSLACDGATNAEEGIRLGYEMANRMFDPRKLNRIILCSDGVANVGYTGPEQILEQIKGYAKKGITLTTVGFGMGNYNDILMEKLGDKGNGHYAYVDDIEEAKRVFVDNLNGTLEVIARDVKIQVEFDSTMVRSYRLIGYENRDVADEDFRNDTVDGGEIGSGHRVTALYELKLSNSLGSGTLGKVQVRFKDSEGKVVREVSRIIDPDHFAKQFDDASYDFRLAATAGQFSEILRDSYWARGEKLADLLPIAKGLNKEIDDKEVAELVSLIERANELKKSLSEK
ncbi:MAG: von Willebrand factor type A domain-containing protein [bacterium]|nr:von Willebrand factor type A domain-containing protein [bacterium]